MKKRNVHGGGSQTNVNGLNFENETDLIKLFEKNRDFVVSKKIIYTKSFTKIKNMVFTLKSTISTNI